MSDAPKKRRRAKKGEPGELSASVRLSVTVAHRVWPPVPLDVATAPAAGPDDIPAATLAVLDAARVDTVRQLEESRAGWETVYTELKARAAEKGLPFHDLEPGDGAGLRRYHWDVSPDDPTGGQLAVVSESLDGVVWLLSDRFVYYPPAPIRAGEAAALGERLRVGVETAARDAYTAALAAGAEARAAGTEPKGRAGEWWRIVWDAVHAHLVGALGLDPAMYPNDPEEPDSVDELATVYVRRFLAVGLELAQAELDAAQEEAELGRHVEYGAVHGESGDDLATTAPAPVEAVEQVAAEAVADMDAERDRVERARLSRAVGLPAALVRYPVFAPTGSRGPVQLSFVFAGYVHGQKFNVLEPQGPMTVRDALLLAHVTRRYRQAGCPSDDRWVRMSLNESARCLGYSGTGSKFRGYVRQAHARMRATMYQHTARDDAGNLYSATWGPIDDARTFEPRNAGAEGRASVKLNESYSALVRSGALAYLNEDTFADLVNRDEYAARLWMFLEGETLGSGWRYSLYSAPEGEPERERDTPAIADLLRMRSWKTRRKVADRVRRACAVIAEVDPAYRLALAHGKGAGMWTLTVEKHDRRKLPQGQDTRGGSPRDAGGVLPGTRGGSPRDAESDSGHEYVQGKSEPAKELPSVLPSEGLTVSGFKSTGIPSQGRQSNDSPICSPWGRIEAWGPDYSAYLADLFGSEVLLKDVAAMVCQHFREASAGEVCTCGRAGAADLDRDGAVEWCPAWDAFRDVTLKLRNYLEKRSGVTMENDKLITDDAAAQNADYVRGAIARASERPDDMMGRTREESKAAYRAMTNLVPRTPAPAAGTAAELRADPPADEAEPAPQSAEDIRALLREVFGEG